MGQSQEPPRVDVLGVEVSAVGLDDIPPIVAAWLEGESSQYLCVTGVHGVMESQDDPELKRIHNLSGLTIPDGMPMVWSGRYAGLEGIDRSPGPSMMLDVCRWAALNGKSSFFYGGNDGVAELVAEKMVGRFPGFKVAGCYTPPFRPLTDEEDREVVEQINASGADLVWVGLSTPKQERWMAEHLDRLDGPVVMFGVGAAFDINAGLVRNAPDWLGRLGFNWLYRLVLEPRRLWRRYLKNNPRFAWSILRRRPRPAARRNPVTNTPATVGAADGEV